MNMKREACDPAEQQQVGEMADAMFRSALVGRKKPCWSPPPPPPFLREEKLHGPFLPKAEANPHLTTVMAPSITDILDVLLEEILLRLPAAEDLALASAAYPSFRRIIADHAFLRRYRALHPPPLIGILDNQKPFVPAQPPHPSSAAARAFAGFDFSCSSFLPSTVGRTWSPIDFFDGRALLAGVQIGNFSRRILVGFMMGGKSLARKLVVCDPVHRRYIMLPAIPVDLNALLHKQELLDLETFLAPGEDEEDPLSFRVICLVQCRMNVLLLVFSSLDGQWHVLTYDQWGASATLAPFVRSDPGLSSRQFVHGCFYWHLHLRNELLVLDLHAMEFSTVSLQSESLGCKSFVLVEAEKGMLGMLTKGNGYDKEIKDQRYWLAYSILTKNQWHLEKVIPLPVKDVCLVGAAGGYLLMYAMHLKSSREKLEFRYFSVDLKTFQVELFTALCKNLPGQMYAGFPNPPGRLYAGYPPSLCAPTI